MLDRIEYRIMIFRAPFWIVCARLSVPHSSSDDKLHKHEHEHRFVKRSLFHFFQNLRLPYLSFLARVCNKSAISGIQLRISTDLTESMPFRKSVVSIKESGGGYQVD